jgi:response regulator RpfG family c-di-GMP phosphodiesterase
LDHSQNDLASRRVFVIEDESLVTMLIQDTLQDIGCEVAALASRFSDALEKATSLSFDVAILDVNLNGTKRLLSPKPWRSAAFRSCFRRGMQQPAFRHRFNIGRFCRNPFNNTILSARFEPRCKSDSLRDF